MFTRVHDPFAAVVARLQALMATLPIISWDWNVDRYGAWVEWVCTEDETTQLFRLERRHSTLAPDPAAAVQTGLDALQGIVETLVHLQALARSPMIPWTAWIAALRVTSSRRPLEPCFQLLGFDTRPVDPLIVRDRYRHLCQTVPSAQSATLAQLREALDTALSLLTPSLSASDSHSVDAPPR